MDLSLGGRCSERGHAPDMQTCVSVIEGKFVLTPFPPDVVLVCVACKVTKFCSLRSFIARHTSYGSALL